MIIIVGAGVVGSWIALKLCEHFDDIFLLEKEPAIWFHTSTRNSGVLHAGIYYDHHSLKRLFCIKGQEQSYNFFKKYNVEHRISGKLIVGFTENDKKKLKQLKIAADLNGVKHLRLVDEHEIKKIEPFCKAKYALYSPFTGVVNCSDYYKKMEALLQEKGINVVTNCKVISVENNLIKTNRGNLKFDILINSAGLNADEIAKLCSIDNFKIIPYKGAYYALNDEKVNSMIYPLPGQEGHLGIHLTKAAYNEIWIGPTSTPVSDKEDYDVKEERELFLQACKNLLSEFNENRVVEGFAGLRPKCFRGNKLMEDFHIFRNGNKVHLLGIDSPGLTAAPAIADYVINLIK